MTKIILEQDHLLDINSLSDTVKTNVLNLIGPNPVKIFTFPVQDILDLFNIDSFDSVSFFNFLLFHKDNEYYTMKHLSSKDFIFITTNNDLTFQLICDALAESFSINQEIFTQLGDENRYLVKPTLVNFIRTELLKKNLVNKETDSSRFKSKI